MYTITQIYKRWQLSKPKIEALLKEHNVTPTHEAFVELASMVYLKKYSVQARYYDSEVIDDIMKEYPYRT